MPLSEETRRQVEARGRTHGKDSALDYLGGGVTGEWPSTERLVDEMRDTFGEIASAEGWDLRPDEDEAFLAWAHAFHRARAERIEDDLDHIRDIAPDEVDEALVEIRGSRRVAEHLAPPGERPADGKLEKALASVNVHRRRIGMSPLDPAAIGWTDEDVLLEAERIARLQNVARHLTA